MAVAKKPKPKAIDQSQHVDVEALIRKGGSVAGDKENKEEGKIASVVLRVPADVMARIDAAVAARRIKTPRHTWLMEAIVEKLDREKAGEE